MSDHENRLYLGDGVYAYYDGFGIWLSANDHRRTFATDNIYLEPNVLDALERFKQIIKKQNEEK